MRFWRKRKQPTKFHQSQLGLERLEDRAMMAVIPLASGQTAVFHDADGTEVKVGLAGPGQGTIELVGGVLTGAAIDTLSLAGTTGQTKLKISTRGGAVAGTTVNDVAIDNALNELGALKHFKGKRVTLTGDFTADGSIEDFHVRSLGNAASVAVTGDVGRFKAESLSSNAQLDVSGTLREFVAKLLTTGSVVEANQLDFLKVKQQAMGASFNIGAGGLALAKLGWVYDSSFAAEGAIGDVVVKGDAMGSGFASNINKGSDGVLGTIDDFVVDPTSTGYIGALKFRGNVGGAFPNQMVAVVSSDSIGDVRMRHHSQQSNVARWQYAASSTYPLSILQESPTGAGYDDDEIWIAVYGKQEGGTHGGDFYYLDPTQIRNGMPVLTTTANITGGITTSSPPTLPSFTLEQWKNASSAWGSNLAFPVPPDNINWSGRILISVGVPVQAQVDTGGSVAAPNPASVTDPATGTIYDFLEFTVVGATASAPTPSLDIDTSQVDAFGLPMKLKLFKDTAGTQAYDFTFTGNVSGNVISNVTNLKHLITHEGLAFGQPVLAAGILVPGTLVADYDVDAGQITLSKPALMSSTGATFTVEMAGPVGVAAYLEQVTGTGPDSLNSFLLNKIAAGSGLARPFLETAAPFLLSGPVQIFGASYDAQAPQDIVITTTGTSVLQNGDTVTISGVQGNTNANGTFTIKDVASTSFTLDGVLGNAGYLGGGTWSLAINGTSTTSAIIASGTATVPTVGETVTIAGVQGNTSVNGKFLVTFVEGSSFALGSPVGDTPYVADTGIWWLPTAKTNTITNVSNSGPFVVTTGYTGDLQNGDLVLISGVQGNPAVNDVFAVESVTTTTFTLKNTTGSGNYTGGGQWQKAQSVTGASHGAAPIVINTADTTGLAVGGVVEIGGVQGNTAANGRYVVTQVVEDQSFTLGSPAGGGAYTSGGTWTGSGGPVAITGATNGGEVVIFATTTAGLLEGDLVEVTGVVGNEGANNAFYISNIDHADNTFKLDGSLATGTYSSGGTWKVYTSLPRLMSPKDVVEALTSPQDTSQLNNYFNEMIDEFFVKYLPSSVTLPDGRTGGGETFSLASTAFNQSSITYTGKVTNVGTKNGNYALQLSDASGKDKTVYNIYYPWFTYNSGANTNAPSPDVYVPLLPLAAAPSWITDPANAWQNQSASQMIFACDAYFADNNARANIDMTGPNAVAVLGDLENSISAAFNRGIGLNDSSTWSNNSTWFPENAAYNYWVQYWHIDGIAFNDLAYAFPYDDKFGFSTNLSIENPGLTQITLGNWSSAAQAVSATTVQTPTPSFALQNGQVTFTANVTGNSPTGTVTFFINGLPINSSNYSNTAPLQPVPVTGGAATLTANLPSLPAPTNTPSGGGVYTVTAVYSGDANNRPSIGYSSLQVNELGVSLSPSSGAVGSTTQISAVIPGTNYNGTISYAISKSDGSNSRTLAPSSTLTAQPTPVTSNPIPNVMTFTGNADGTTKISGISNMTDLKVGQNITGTGVPTGTTIQSVGVDSITLNNTVSAGTGIALTSDGLGASLLVTVNFVGATNSDPSYSGFAYFTVT